MIPFISLFEIINVALPDLKISLRIAASVTNAAANSNRITTLLDSGLSTFFIKGNPVLSRVPKSVPENPRDCPILCN